jgi:hypothetical protein
VAYKRTLLFLSTFAPAGSYCWAHFPLPSVRVIVTATADATTTYDAGTAINACVNQAFNDLFFYDSLDLHFLKLEQIWECVQYYSPNTDNFYVNVANRDVIQGYSYHMVGPFHPL